MVSQSVDEKKEKHFCDEIKEFLMKKSTKKVIGLSVIGFTITQILPRIIKVEETSVVGWIIIAVVVYLWMEGRL